MVNTEILGGILSFKIRNLCLNYISGIECRLGKLYYVYVKDFYMDDEEVDLTVGYTPKENTIFVSKYLNYTKLLPMYIPNLHEKTMIEVDTYRNKNPITITKYNLYKLLSPVNHKENFSTILEQVKINCKVVLDGRFLIGTPYSTLELNPTFHLVRQQISGNLYGY